MTRAIESGGGKVIQVQGDVSRTDDIRQLFDETAKAFGRIITLSTTVIPLGLARLRRLRRHQGGGGTLHLIRFFIKFLNIDKLG
jgi:NAD(P)-dependent dehydrogenase (short-subunit alcohol dehydrogenase family)